MSLKDFDFDDQSLLDPDFSPMLAKWNSEELICFGSRSIHKDSLTLGPDLVQTSD